MKKYFSRLADIWAANGNQGNRLNAVLRGLFWFARSRFTSKPSCREVFGDRKIWCHPDGFISRSVMLFGEWNEYDSLKFIYTFLRPGDNFLDVGANVGLFSILASKTVSPESIFCVEPGKTQRSRLEDNFRLNRIDGVHIYPFAVGDTAGSANFSTEDAVSHILESASQADNSEVVEIRRLDSFLPKQIFHLTKIDVEGFELPALRGASGLLENAFLPVMLLELNGSSERFGIQTYDILAFLESCGYRVGVYRHDENVISCSDHLWNDVLAFNEAGEKLIRERIERVRIT